MKNSYKINTKTIHFTMITSRIKKKRTSNNMLLCFSFGQQFISLTSAFKGGTVEAGWEGFLWAVGFKHFTQLVDKNG